MGFSAILFHPGSSFFFGRATDLADHNDRLGIRILVEHLKHVQMRCAVDRIPSDANTGTLSVASGSQLPDGFVGQGSGAGNHTDIALLVNVSWRYPDSAAAMEFGPSPGVTTPGQFGPTRRVF